jgi:glutathione S-transferase
MVPCLFYAMLPVLYSFRRCPYAIRARLAIRVSGLQVELREVQLADKPAEMLAVSAKGTVPVLLLPDGTVIDESRDIVSWALHLNDPENWLGDYARQLAANRLIDTCDGPFKQHLDHYKYAVRYPEHPPVYYREKGEEFLRQLNDLLVHSRFLLADDISLADMAIMPFVRQFAFVDKAWFDASPYAGLQRWLAEWLEMPLFTGVMQKYPRWQPGGPQTLF